MYGMIMACLKEAWKGYTQKVVGWEHMKGTDLLEDDATERPIIKAENW